MDDLPVPDSAYRVRDRLLRRPTSKPDVEFLTSLSLEQCQTHLSELMDFEPSPRFLKKRIRGRVRGNDFYCHVLWNAFFDFGGLIIFKGKMIPILRGTYVTGRFRSRFGVMLLEIIWLALGLYSLLQYPDQPLRPLFVVASLFLIVWFISRRERRLRPYLIKQLHQVLSDHR